jgi:hypothetical protein
MVEGEYRYFADENTLGLAKLMIASGRSDVLHPGFGSPPPVPLGTPDVEWMKTVADLGLIVITRDRRIRSRPAELRAYMELGIRSVWLGAKRDLRPADQFAMFERHEARLLREAVKRGDGPWALSLTDSGVRPLRLPD